jgi:integrase
MAGVPLAQARTEYLEHLMRRKLAKNTISGNSSMLNGVMRALGTDFLTSRLEAEHIDDILAVTCWGPSTAETNLAYLKGFMKWAKQRRYMRPEQEPLLDYRVRGKRNTRAQTRLRLNRREGEWDVLLEAADKIHPRDRAVCAIGLYLMPRIEELANLRIGDLDFDNHTVTLHRSKVDGVDVMPMASELAEELQRWLSVYEAAHGELNPSWYVIPAFGHSPRTLQGRYGIIPSADFHPTRFCTHPYEVVKRALKATGRYTDEQLHWSGGHCLRRSGARELYENLKSQGVDNALRLVQVWLGHTTLAHTMTYIGVDADREERNRRFAGRQMFATVQPTIPPLRVLEGGNDGQDSGRGTHLRPVQADGGSHLEGGATGS